MGKLSLRQHIENITLVFALVQCFAKLVPSRLFILCDSGIVTGCKDLISFLQR